MKNAIFTVILLIGTICFLGIAAEAVMRILYRPVLPFDLDKMADKFKEYSYNGSSPKRVGRNLELTV